MGHTHTNISVHIMWATENSFQIDNHARENLYAFLNALIRKKNGVLLFAGGCYDHVHFIISMPKDESLSGFLCHLKSSSSKWLKNNNIVSSTFGWQDGYCASSTQPSMLEDVRRYIRNDKERHSRKSYIDELLTILRYHDIQYKEEYLLNTSYSKIYLHIVWSTNNREPYIDKVIKEPLYNNIRENVSKLKGNTIAIGGVEDHLHLLIEMPRQKSLSDLVREIKTSSTHWIKLSNNNYRDFHWQIGFGAFSVSQSEVNGVVKYINNQEDHHKKFTFANEWNSLLRDSDLPGLHQGVS